MTTRVKHKGTNKEVEVSIEAWGKHENVIRAYCDGEHVELRRNEFHNWESTSEPGFHRDVYYRVAEKKPRLGQVWSFENSDYLYVHDDKFVLISTVDGEGKYRIARDYWIENMTKVADSPEQYYAKKFAAAADERCDMCLDKYPNCLAILINEHL